MSERSLANLRLGRPIQPGEVRNPTGANGFTAMHRFREAFEAVATDEDLVELALDLLQKAKRGSKLEPRDVSRSSLAEDRSNRGERR